MGEKTERSEVTAFVLMPGEIRAVLDRITVLQVRLEKLRGLLEGILDQDG